LAETKIMEEIIRTPMDPSASGGAVANSPPKPRIPPIRQRIRGPFTRYLVVNGPVSKLALKPAVPTRPLVRQKIAGPVHPAVNERVSKPTLNPISSIESELAEVRSAWERYRSTNGRDAIYIYLTAVFRLVMRWRRLNCAVKNSKATLRLQADAPQMKSEPFGIVIFCTSDPEAADAKTRSKWSRVLRYARTAKPGDQRLTDFIKSNGGLNECAARFSGSVR
jgi:hypothetical protein